MGLVTKIFIVVVLVLALFATAVQIAIFAKRHQFQVELFNMAKAIAERDKDIKDKTAEHDLYKTNATDRDKKQTDRIRALTDARDNLQASNMTLEEDKNRAVSKIDELRTFAKDQVELAAGLNEQLHREIGNVRKLNDTLADLKVEAETNRHLKESLERMLNMSLIERENLISSEKIKDSQIARLREENAKLLAGGSTGGGGKTIKVGEIKSRPTITGRVMNIKTDLGTGIQSVILDVGKSEGVSTGLVFTVYRGNTYVGKVRVAKVYLRYSLGSSIQDDTVKLIKLDDKVIYSTSR